MSALRSSLVMAVLTVALVACGSGGGTAGSRSAASSGPGTEAASTPSVEGSGPESPQRPHDSGPAINDASLPVGGADTGDPNDPSGLCADLALVQPPPLGVTLHIKSVAFDPDGIFALGGSACSGDVTVCRFPTDVTAQSLHDCSVSIQQKPNATGSTSVSLVADFHCTTQQLCDSYRASLPRTQKVLIVVPSDGGSGDTSSTGGGMPSGSATTSPGGEPPSGSASPSPSGT